VGVLGWPSEKKSLYSGKPLAPLPARAESPVSTCSGASVDRGSRPVAVLEPAFSVSFAPCSTSGLPASLTVAWAYPEMATLKDAPSGIAESSVL